MGLIVSTQYGIPIVSHGGSLFGYKSDMIFLPDHGIGAVILTNSDTGGYLTGFFRRRLLEVLFDGKPEASEQARTAAKQRGAGIAKHRERLEIPADGAEAAQLANRYSSPALGELVVRSQDGVTIFDFGKWHSEVGSRRNDDGTTSFISIDPTIGGFNFVAGTRDGKRTLMIRDAQHEYAFVESASPQSGTSATSLTGCRSAMFDLRESEKGWKAVSHPSASRGRLGANFSDVKTVKWGFAG